MVVRFVKTAYLDAVKDSENFNNEEKIFQYAKEHLQFTYGEVTYQKFSDPGFPLGKGSRPHYCSYP